MNEIIAVTGHRPNKLGGYAEASQRLLTQIALEVLVEEKPSMVITGMALGWDQAVARACIKLHIPFTAAIPFDGQENTWPERSQMIYRMILERSHKVEVVSEGGYCRLAMQVRNEWMINQCHLLLALWDGNKSGGTYHALTYARQLSVPVINYFEKWKELYGRNLVHMGE